MNKIEIVHQVYERLDKKIPMKDLEKIFELFLNVMSDELKKGNEVQLADFGTFALAEKSIKLVIKKKISKSKK
jgi:DNA-binding protein HU-beta